MKFTLPKLPSSWSPTRLDHVATVNARVGWKALTASEYVPDGYVFLATPNIKSNEIDFEDVNYINEFRFEESPELRLQQDDILLVKDGNTLGITNIVVDLPRAATVNGSIAVIRTHVMEPRFLRYALASDLVQGMIRAVKAGMGVPHLFQADIKKFPLPMPPRSVQRAIADYLDRETTRIDSLIEAKRRMVDLLHERWDERRRHAVTAGLAPDAPMQSLRKGLVPVAPTHWKLSKLAYLGKIRSGATPSKDRDDYWDGNVPWVSPKDMKVLELSSTVDKVSMAAVRDTGLALIAPSSVLFVVRGMILAHTFPVSINSVITTINQDMKALSLQEDKARFVAHLLAGLSQSVLSAMVEEAAHGTKALRMDRWKEFCLALPPVNEQQDIAEVLDQEARIVSRITALIEHQVALLIERRRALIAAAVTGQIDIPEAT